MLITEDTPEFYGYVPTKPFTRTLVFASLVLSSAGMLLLRCMTIVLLGLVGQRWVFLYLGSDLCFYFIVKIARGDFWYWIPAGKYIDIVISTVFRAVIKITTDFTSVVQMRHPNEVGGACWLFGALMTFLSLPVVLFLTKDIATITKFGREFSIKTAQYAIPLALFWFAVFFFNIERKYWKTFWSLQRGKDVTIKNFRRAKEDSIKANFILTTSRHYWISVEEEVRTWIETNWEKWEEERPNWYNENMRNAVPLEFIPTTQGRTAEEKRRESAGRESDAESLSLKPTEERMISESSCRTETPAKDEFETKDKTANPSTQQAARLSVQKRKEGTHLGKELFESVKRRERWTTKEEAVKEFISVNTILEQASDQFSVLEPLIIAVVNNKLQQSRKVEGELKNLDEEEGRAIGESLARTLAVNTSPEASVYEWILQYPALVELDYKFIWFRPMLVGISYKLLEEVSWGLKTRVTVGAFTSMADLVTDFYVTYSFLRDEKKGYFVASLVSLMSSIGFQILLVWSKNRKIGTARVFRESFPILIGFKPALDAYRVAKGAKQETGQVIEPLIEMSYIKGIEMFAEAIPGVIIQLMAIATSNEEIAAAAWISLTVSALTTGFASATISYDFDTDPRAREQVPEFYGYIPAKASKRTLVFASLVLFTAGMLLIRCVTIVLLMFIGHKWTILYICADLALYLAVKILRGDFWYWMPLGGKAEILSSFVCRILVKVVTDFTSIVQFRHPNEVGGLAWILGFVLTLGSLPVAIIVAESHLTERMISIAWNVVYLIPGTLICFAVFFFNIEKEYWHTFWSAQRSKEMTMSYFLEGKSDVQKVQVFSCSRNHWISIEEEVKRWVGLNWEEWEREEPEWFDDNLRNFIPLEFIPKTDNARRRTQLRRASVKVGLESYQGGNLNIRRASLGSGGIAGAEIVKIEKKRPANIKQANRAKGKALVENLLRREKGMLEEEVLEDFFAVEKAFEEVSDQYEMFAPMVLAVYKNRLYRVREVSGRLRDLDEKEGKDIGESLATGLATNTVPEAAVDEWIMQFPALKELDEHYDWFRPLLVGMSYKLMEEVPWGMKMRVTVGAVTSISDLLTDTYVTYLFWSEGKEGYFKASLASLMLSIGIQILVVWDQNKKLGRKRVLRECLPIILGYKPAVDAFRVATGLKQEIGTAFDPMLEMTCIKCVEMFAEAIPGVIIQLMAIVTSSGRVSGAALFSLSISALTTGFASATISYDFDTDPKRRLKKPEFYGYIPAKASTRSLMFVSMVIMTAGMLLIRCMTIVVIGLMGTSWVALYIGGDLGLYLVVKMLRGDFWSWLPLGGGKAELVNSIINRVLVKLITDFTSIVQFRHPNEVGGIFWLFGFAFTIVSLPVAVTVADTHLTERVISTAWNVVTYIIPATLVFFVVFFLTLEREYLNTFLSTQRGKDLTMSYFLQGQDDEVMYEVMTYTRHHWVSIEDKVRKWVLENWARWEEEKPEWFTDQMKAKVPVEFIPTTGEARRRESVRRASLDAEAEGGLGGALRASIRRASVGTTLGGDVARVVPIKEDN